MFKHSLNSPAQRKGLHFEKRALAYLKQQGLKLLERNYHCTFGEIDLIMQDGESIVFVEVRFRQRLDFGSAVETVDSGKQSRLVRTATCYLLQHHLYDKTGVRFDVVSITQSEGKPDIHWFRDAFQTHTRHQ